MTGWRGRLSGWADAPFGAALLIVAVVLGGLPFGYEPVGQDPDLLYRPIKAELARALREGHLPFWSDRFGLGVPLVAESHAAGFYPPNWVLYGLLDVATAYRWAMWLHFLLLVASTFAYARCLGISRWGAALAGVSFSLCGFLAIHAVHEPFYHVMPYLPLALLAAHRYAETGGAGWMSLLALTLGVQLTLGHFQIQMWTAGVAILTGSWRVFADRLPRVRVVGLVVAVIWGGSIAWVQLALTRELTEISGFARPTELLTNFAFPPGHWAQPALPGLFLGREGGPPEPYWQSHGTSAGEACFYVGTVTLVLAFVGLVAKGGGREWAPWKFLLGSSLVLAMLPGLWPEGARALVRVPGFGLFRCPARYTLLASLALCLFAGRGLDRGLSGRRFLLGVALATVFGIGAVAWGGALAVQTPSWAGEGGRNLVLPLVGSGAAWGLGLGSIVLWRLGRVGPIVPIVLAAGELGLLFYSVNPWDWRAPSPAESPILARLANEAGGGLIAGRLEDLPVRAGMVPAYPYLGITPPPPNYLLADSRMPEGFRDPQKVRWFRRFGVSTGVWAAGDETPRGEPDFEEDDPVLDRLVASRAREGWKVVRYPGASPTAWAATRVRVVDDWYQLYGALSKSDEAEVAWFTGEDAPAEGDPGARARVARVVEWDGRVARVEHDGDCDLIVRGAHYPGWMARVGEGPERPVARAQGGLRAVRLVGKGLSRIEFRYEPGPLEAAGRVSTVAAVLALLGLGIGPARRFFARRVESLRR
jgi:hypothetical protein